MTAWSHVPAHPRATQFAPRWPEKPGPYDAARVIRRVCVLAVVIALAAIATTPGEAAVRFKRTGEATLGGIDALAELREACEAGSGRVWVRVDERGDCIAFFAPKDLHGAKTAVFYFEGDIPANYRRNPVKLRSHLAIMRKTLAQLGRTYAVPFVFVSRPGTFHSTGNHSDRRKSREYLVMNATVTAIKQRFEIKSVSLAGQSGGATIVGALLTLGRDDILCASPASGGFDLPAMLDWHAERLGLKARHREHPARLADHFNVIERVLDVRPDPQRRIFIIGDPNDRVTPFNQQKAFASQLKAAGHRALLIEGRGSGKEHHGLTLASLRAAGLCASGASDQSIRRRVGR